MRTATLIVSITICVAMASLTACDTTKAPAGARQDPLYSEAYPSVVLMEGLDRGLVAGEPIVTHATPERPMQVTVPIRSIDDRPLNVQYRFLFLDEAGRPMNDGPGGWRFVNIGPRVQIFVKGNSMEALSAVGSARGTNPADWRLELRPAR